MIKNLIRTSFKLTSLLAIITAVNISMLIAADDDIQATGKTSKKDSGTEKDVFDYSLDIYAQGGYVNNFMSYPVSSATAGSGLKFKIDFGGKIFTPSFSYKLDGKKYFTAVDGTDQTLDSLDQRFGVEGESKLGKNSILLFFDYDWLLRPNWPDLYQPAGGIPDNGYESTDRYSHHKFNQGISIKNKSFHKTFIWMTIDYTKKFGYIDPNYRSANPTHLTPSRYTEFTGEIGYRTFDKDRPLNWRITNQTTYHAEDKELSHDSKTGTTHYSTTPNPLYKEIHNESDAELTWSIQSIMLDITPMYHFHFNKDTYQGYYSYTQHDIGIKLEGALLAKTIEYSLSAERKLRTYTSDAKTGTTDGATLYKNYWDFSGEIDYHLTKTLTLYVEADIKKKKTNYPSYDYPADSYDVDFFYDNKSVNLGVKYSL